MFACVLRLRRGAFWEWLRANAALLGFACVLRLRRGAFWEWLRGGAGFLGLVCVLRLRCGAFRCVVVGGMMCAAVDVEACGRRRTIGATDSCRSMAQGPVGVRECALWVLVLGAAPGGWRPR